MILNSPAKWRALIALHDTPAASDWQVMESDAEFDVSMHLQNLHFCRGQWHSIRHSHPAYSQKASARQSGWAGIARWQCPQGMGILPVSLIFCIFSMRTTGKPAPAATAILEPIRARAFSPEHFCLPAS